MHPNVTRNPHIKVAKMAGNQLVVRRKVESTGNTIRSIGNESREKYRLCDNHARR